MKHYIIIGATSSIAEHCMRLWQEKTPQTFTLVARNEEKLQRVVNDLQIRQPHSKFYAHIIDFKDPETIEAFVTNLYATQAPDIILIAQGWLGDQNQCQDSLSYCKEMLEINAISPILFAEAFCKHMEKAKKGHLILLGSVAGERGRKSMYVYGASKSCMDHYVQGLHHRFVRSPIKITIVKPGPTQTPMIANLTFPIKAAPVEKVANDIVDGVAKCKRVIFTPGKWKWMMCIVRNIPSSIFERLEL